jgi:hypothetical protein
LKQLEVSFEDLNLANLQCYQLGATDQLLGLVGADLDSTAVNELMTRNRMTMIWTALAIVLLSVLLVYGFAHYLTRPLVKLKKIIGGPKACGRIGAIFPACD